MCGRRWKVVTCYLWKAVWMDCHQQLLRLTLWLVRVIYGELMLVYVRVFVRVHARVFGGSKVALHHPPTFLSPPLSWPPAWVNAEAPSLHLLVAPFVCEPNPALDLSPPSLALLCLLATKQVISLSYRLANLMPYKIVLTFKHKASQCFLLLLAKSRLLIGEKSITCLTFKCYLI